MNTRETKVAKYKIKGDDGVTQEVFLMAVPHVNTEKRHKNKFKTNPRNLNDNP